MVAVYAIGYSMMTALSTPAILEMHGNQNLALVFGLEMLMYGSGSFISPTTSGKYLISRTITKL